MFGLYYVIFKIVLCLYFDKDDYYYYVLITWALNKLH